jgi:hypothetical protein
LNRVFRVLDRTKDAVTVHVQLAAVRLDEFGEGILLAALRPGDQFGRHGSNRYSGSSLHVLSVCSTRARRELGAAPNAQFVRASVSI